MVLFIIGQVLINLKRGMVFSPFYHYGMYSEVMKPQPGYTVFEIEVDGQPLRTADFSAQQWDQVMVPVAWYGKHREWNEHHFAELKRITGISDSTRYVNQVTKRGFYGWYQGYLSGILGREIRSVNIIQKTYSPGQ